MNKLGKAIYGIEHMNELAGKERWVNKLHPLSKLFLSVFYIVTVVSFSKYALSSLLTMAIYPIIMFTLCELSFKDALRRLKIVLPFVCILGIFNPFFDRQIVTYLDSAHTLPVTGGTVSMLSLMIKGVLTVLASYILVATTRIEDLCGSLTAIHVPKVIVTELLLIYRYISVLLKEVNNVTLAYSLRAPGQKGINYKSWGSLVGQILLRSIDRADEIYESMSLRGFNGHFDNKRWNFKTPGYPSLFANLLFVLIWCGIMLLFKLVPVIYIIGNLFM